MKEITTLTSPTSLWQLRAPSLLAHPTGHPKAWAYDAARAAGPHGEGGCDGEGQEKRRSTGVCAFEGSGTRENECEAMLSGVCIPNSAAS